VQFGTVSQDWVTYMLLLVCDSIISLPQAFYIVAGSYQQVTKGTEMRQRALDIFWTFFIENSVSVDVRLS